MVPGLDILLLAWWIDDDRAKGIEGYMYPNNSIPLDRAPSHEISCVAESVVSIWAWVTAGTSNTATRQPSSGAVRVAMW
jgi:hypothetical protein